MLTAVTIAAVAGLGLGLVAVRHWPTPIAERTIQTATNATANTGTVNRIAITAASRRPNGSGGSSG